MIVDTNRAIKSTLLRVYLPDRLPLTYPKVFKVQVDAGDVDLKISFLVKAESSSRGSLSIVILDVLVHCLFNLCSVQITIKSVRSLIS